MSAETNGKKEKTQLAVLILLALTVVSLLYWMLVLKPLNDEFAKVDKQLDECEARQQTQAAFFAKAQKVQDDFLRLNEELFLVMENELPPEENPMAWSGELVRRSGSVASIPEANRAFQEIRQSPVRGEDQSFLEDYKVSVDLFSGYHQFGTFLANLEREVPFLVVDSFAISKAQGKEDQNLRINLKCSLPRFSPKGFPAELHPESPLTAIGRIEEETDSI